MQKRVAFQSLLQRLRPMSNFSEVFITEPSGRVCVLTGMRTS